MIAAIEITTWQIALAALLILINGIVSFRFRLGMERTLVFAAIRTVVQLWLLGLILTWVFELKSWWLVLSIAAVMTTIAGWTAASRPKYRFPGMRRLTLAAVWASSWLLTGYVICLLMADLRSWYDPQYLIPLLGMVLGNTLNGISVALSSLVESMSRRRVEVETLTALGATRMEASADAMRDAIRTGMIPIINSMMVVGLVSMPGMMTGQVIAGMDPAQAIRYQIVIMFIIAAATAAGTVSVVYLAIWKLFGPDHRFRYEVLLEREKQT